jgi:hypothetical protein
VLQIYDYDIDTATPLLSYGRPEWKALVRTSNHPNESMWYNTKEITDGNFKKMLKEWKASQPEDGTETDQEDD